MPRTDSFFNKPNLLAAAFLVLLAILLWLLYSLLQPFLSAFIWALILTMVFYPVYTRLLKWTGGRASLASLLALLVVVVLLALPGFILVVNLGQEVGRTYENLSKVDWQQKSQALVQPLKSVGLQNLLAKWGLEPSDVERLIRDGLSSTVQGLNKFILAKVSSLLQNMVAFLAECVFVVFCIFFFFRDGAFYAGRVVEFLPLQKTRRDEVMKRFSQMVSSVVRAMFVTALAQGLFAGVGFAVAGVPFPILLGLVTAFGSFIPYVGATVVWLPASIFLLIQNQTLPAVLLALWGVGVVSMADNVLKPMIIGGEAKLPVFLVFFTTLGGIKLYGFLGVFLGPIILSMGLAFLAIYRDLYLNSPNGKPTKFTVRRKKAAS